MNNKRAMELLNNVVNYVAIGTDSSEQIDVLVNRIGFSGEELVSEFGYSKSDVEDITGDTVNDVIKVTVYRTEIDPGYNGDDNLMEIEVDRQELFKFFVNIVASTESGDATSDEDRFEAWLDEYTADDTVGLYDYIGNRNSEAAIAYFEALYEEKMESLTKKAQLQKAADAGAEAKELFGEKATEEEMVGYYLKNFGLSANSVFQANIEYKKAHNLYKNADESKRDEAVGRVLTNLCGVGCYGAGSEACLTGCTGCGSCKYTEARSFSFKTKEEMYDTLMEGKALYNPISKIYVFKCEDGIGVYRNISVEKAKQLSIDMKETGHSGWCDFLDYWKRTTYSYDVPFGADDSEINMFCSGIYKDAGWVLADGETFAPENTKYILKSCDIRACDWIIGISGSELNDVVTEIVHGTTDEVKNYLVTCVQSDRDGDRDEWDSGTEKTSEVSYNDDGTLYAFGNYKDYHMDYTARPLVSLRKTELHKVKEVA